jgi:luciferase family oxidoreductase group 1
VIPLSILDLVPVRAGFTAGEAMAESVSLAQLAERLGYARYWFAEHHGMGAIASTVPELLIEHVASATAHIRVGSGGIMLPNHTPLRVAEVFHTLETLHPGRIDLGMGRAPGTDPATSRALRPFDAEQFPDQVKELLALSRRTLPPDHPFATVRVVPGDVDLPPIWVLASSGATAAFAGSMGLGYGFARHFSPAPPGPPIRAYRQHFQPSAQFPDPHVILGISVICAPTDDEADYLARSSDLGWVRLHRREFAPLPSPEEASRYEYSPSDRVIVEMNRLRHFIGTPEKVAATMRHIAADTEANELMVTSTIYGSEERRRCYELLAREWGLPAPG